MGEGLIVSDADAAVAARCLLGRSVRRGESPVVEVCAEGLAWGGPRGPRSSPHVLARTADGKIFSWGAGHHDKLGHGDVEHQLVPKQIAALAPVAAAHEGPRSSHATQ